VRAGAGAAIVGRGVAALHRVVPVRFFVVGVAGVAMTVERVTLRVIVLTPARPETAHG
jgi:hypothetical protein